MQFRGLKLFKGYVSLCVGDQLNITDDDKILGKYEVNQDTIAIGYCDEGVVVVTEKVGEIKLANKELTRMEM